MGKKTRPEYSISPLPRRYISIETLLILFPELGDKLNDIPTQVIDGNSMYDVLAAVDVVNASRPPTSGTDDLTENDIAFGDYTDI